MNLLIASVSAATSPTGVCRHAANLALGMTALPAVHKVTMLTGDWQSDYFRDAFGMRNDKLEIVRVSIENTSLARNLWYLRGLPTAAKAFGVDIVHLAFPMPVVRSTFTVPLVVSLHDLYPFDIPGNFGKTALLNRAALRVCLHGVDAVSCVSETTETRLREVFSTRTYAKAVVIPNSISVSQGTPSAALPDAIHSCPFLLCVAQHRANKNLLLLLRSFRLALDRDVLSARTKLVLVGNEGPETAVIRQTIAQHDLGGQVVLLRGISDGLLLALYQDCELVVAPSLIEGFGLPVAEAAAAGSRIVCSDIPEFHEPNGAQREFFNPMDDSGESLVAALEKTLAHPRSGVGTIRVFDPRQAASMYFDLYRSLLAPAADHSVSEPISISIQKPRPSERHSL